MTTLQITLPDSLTQEAKTAGLLVPEVLEQLFRDHLEALRIERLRLTENGWQMNHWIRRHPTK